MENIDESSIFMPLQAIDNVPTFMNLSNHSFSSAEKLWLCSTVAAGRIIEYNSIELKFSAYRVAKRYNINVNTVKAWIRRYKRAHVVHIKTGRPRILDDIAIIEAREYGHAAGGLIAMGPRRSNDCLRKHANDTRERRFKQRIDRPIRASKTIRKYIRIVFPELQI